MDDTNFIPPEELEAFREVATIRDDQRFLALLAQLVARQSRQGASAPAGDGQTPQVVPVEVREQAERFRSATAHRPATPEFQQARKHLLNQFEEAGNLAPAAYAILARKSRQQVYKDVRARRLLAISVGKRGVRIPDWQLGDAALVLSQRVLAEAEDADPWTIYRALSTPDEALGGVAPVRAVQWSNLDAVAGLVCARLGVYG